MSEPSGSEPNADERVPSDLEGWVSRSVRSLREQRGWNQSELARRMQAEGFEAYNQMLVSRTEKGERPIRLNEVQGYANVFEVPIGELFVRRGSHALLETRIQKLSKLERQLRSALRDYLLEQGKLAAAMNRTQGLEDIRGALPQSYVKIALSSLAKTPFVLAQEELAEAQVRLASSKTLAGQKLAASQPGRGRAETLSNSYMDETQADIDFVAFWNEELSNGVD